MRERKLLMVVNRRETEGFRTDVTLTTSLMHDMLADDSANPKGSFELVLSLVGDASDMPVGKEVLLTLSDGTPLTKERMSR